MALVLNLRPVEQAAELTAALKRNGFNVLAIPAIEITAEWNPAEMRRVDVGLRTLQFEWVVFSSANAARFLVEGLRANGGVGDIGSVNVVCGASTARSLPAMGLSAGVTLGNFSALSALEMLLSRGIRGSVLAPRAAEGRPELLEGLAERGVPMMAPVVYRSQPVTGANAARIASAIQQGEIAAIAATSPSILRSLAKAMENLERGVSALLREVPIVCIGETTASEARLLGITPAGVAAVPSEAGLAAAIQALIRMEAVA